MSSKRFSPTASALRSSRFFSLPPPLQRPPEYVSSNAFISNPQSNTATLPYPVQQAVTSSPSSAARGDWGLKRSLPWRSVRRANNPTFRINAVDTREHVTDFDPALDLTVTREKFAELGMPITTVDRRPSHRNRKGARSVFDPALDNTDRDAPGIDPTTKEEMRRWKFEGPWLGGLSEGEFLHYVEKELRNRKDEFLAFVRQQEAQRRHLDRSHSNTAAYGRNRPVAKTPATMTDQEFAAVLRELRSNFSPSSSLAEHITRFLDLPELAPSSQAFGKSTNSAADKIYSAQRTMSTGPHTTHPSAGLSYLRSDAVLSTHRIYGPLARPPPHVARVLQSDIVGRAQPVLGVAGFAAEEGSTLKTGRLPTTEVARQTALGLQKRNALVKEDERYKTIGVAIEGGTKIWVEPVRASVDEAGMVKLHVEKPENESVEAKTEVLGSTRVVGQQVASPVAEMAQTTPAPARGGGGPYGIGKQRQQQQEEEGDRRTERKFGLLLDRINKTQAGRR